MIRLAALAALLALPAAAQERESERFERKRVAAGEIVSRTLECDDDGQLTGGGYRLYGQPDDALHYQVLGSYPFGDNGWRVDLRNITDQNRELAFRIYVLCN